MFKLHRFIKTVIVLQLLRRVCVTVKLHISCKQFVQLPVHRRSVHRFSHCYSCVILHCDKLLLTMSHNARGARCCSRVFPVISFTDAGGATTKFLLPKCRCHYSPRQYTEPTQLFSGFLLRASHICICDCSSNGNSL